MKCLGHSPVQCYATLHRLAQPHLAACSLPVCSRLNRPVSRIACWVLRLCTCDKSCLLKFLDGKKKSTLVQLNSKPVLGMQTCRVFQAVADKSTFYKRMLQPVGQRHCYSLGLELFSPYLSSVFHL